MLMLTSDRMTDNPSLLDILQRKSRPGESRVSDDIDFESEALFESGFATTITNIVTATPQGSGESSEICALDGVIEFCATNSRWTHVCLRLLVQALSRTSPGASSDRQPAIRDGKLQVLQLLARFLDIGAFSNLLKSAEPSDFAEGADNAALLQLVFSIPDRASNFGLSAPSVSAPAGLLPQQLYHTLRRDLIGTLLASAPNLRRSQVADAVSTTNADGTSDWQVASGGDAAGASAASDAGVRIALDVSRVQLNVAAAVEKFCKLGHTNELAGDWAQYSYQHVGMGGCSLLLQHFAHDAWAGTSAAACAGPQPQRQQPPEAAPLPVTDRPEFPNAITQLQRALDTGCAGRYLVQCIPNDHVPRFMREVVLACAGIALDYTSATPAAGRLVHPANAEAAFGQAFASVLTAEIGRADELPSSALLSLQLDFWLKHAVPGIVARGVVLYLLHPTAVAYGHDTTGSSAGGGAGGDLRAVPPADVIRAHGYAPTSTASLQLSLPDWLSRFPFLTLAERWSHPAFVTSCEPTMHASITRLLVHAIGLAPSEAFEPTCTLLLVLMNGVQARMDHSNEYIRRQGLAVAVAFSQRTSPGQPLQFDELASMRSPDHQAPSSAGSGDNDSMQLRASAGDTAVDPYDVSIVQAFDRLRSGRGASPWLLDFDPEGARLNRAAASTSASDSIALDGDVSSHAIQVAPAPATSATGDADQTEGQEADKEKEEEEDEALTAARRRFGSRAPTYLRHAYNRLIALMKEDSGATNNKALPIPGGQALDEDADAVEGPDGCTAVMSVLERLIRRAAEDPTSGQNQLLELTIPLLRTLLALSNRYNQRHFPAWRMGAMVAITSCAAPLACHYLFSRYGAANMGEEQPLLAARSTTSTGTPSSDSEQHHQANGSSAMNASGAAYAGDASETTKMEVVDILVAAARELSGVEPPIAPPLPPWERKAWRPVDVDDVNGSTDATEASGEDGEEDDGAANASDGAGAGGAVHPNHVDSRNLFGPVASAHFFFPLMRSVVGNGRGLGFESMRETSPAGASLSAASSSDSTSHAKASEGEFDYFGTQPLADGNARLLSQALQALAVFIEAASSDPSVPSMARALLPLAWFVRSHASVGVRRAALSAIAACIAAIHRHEQALLLSPSLLTSMAMAGSGAGASHAVNRGDGVEGAPVAHSIMSDLTSVSQRMSNVDGLSRIAAAVSASASLSSVRNRASLSSALAAGSTHSMIGAPDEPSVWDDLVLLVAHLRSTADSDADDVCRALSRAMLSNEILKELVLGPLADMRDDDVPPPSAESLTMTAAAQELQRLDGLD